MNSNDLKDAQYAFAQFCQGFVPHGEREYPDRDSWFKDRIKNFISASAKPKLKAYLDELLDGSYTDTELFNIFLSTNPTFGFRSKNARPWMTAVREELTRLIDVETGSG